MHKLGINKLSNQDRGTETLTQQIVHISVYELPSGFKLKC